MPRRTCCGSFDVDCIFVHRQAAKLSSDGSFGRFVQRRQAKYRRMHGVFVTVKVLRPLTVTTLFQEEGVAIYHLREIT
ncbi:hypothetical protein EYF80_026863 [Liparis tanakae]|uniref:Uncharacterized protein n=1 Tax=Liparis tanakae TaxID=230148 RepID=A0A4Z2HBA6_9TELE|nr:hypothetical protein EYF80_026863 [Liparis tanakae]